MPTGWFRDRLFLSSLAVLSVGMIAGFLFSFVILGSTRPESGDLFAYWSAYGLLQKGGNPYDPVALLTFQRQFIPDLVSPQNVWNPPIVFLLLSPLLSLPLPIAAWLLTGISAGLACLTALLIWRTIHDYNPSALWLLVGAINVPLITDLVFRQISLVITTAFALVLLLLHSKRSFAAGLLSVVFLLKPHSLYLVWAYLILRSLQKREWQFVGGLIIGTALAGCLCEMAYPGILSQWFSRSWPTSFAGSSLPSFIRACLHTRGADWPAACAVVPGVTLAWLLLRFRKTSLSSRENAIYPLVCLSLITAPYGFIFDQSALIVVQTALIALSGKRRLTVASLLIASHFLVIVLLSALFATLPTGWIATPILLLLIWFIGARLGLLECRAGGNAQSSEK